MVVVVIVVDAVVGAAAVVASAVVSTAPRVVKGAEVSVVSSPPHAAPRSTTAMATTEILKCFTGTECKPDPETSVTRNRGSSGVVASAA